MTTDEVSRKAVVAGSRKKANSAATARVNSVGSLMWRIIGMRRL
jgi:hypothetical protein